MNHILDDVCSVFLDSVDGCLASEKSSDWRAVISECKNLPIYYKLNFIRYQTEYFSNAYEKFVDISSVIYRGGKAVGVWPLCIFKKEGLWQIGSLGGSLLPPKLSGHFKAETERKIYEKCLSSLYAIAKLLKIQYLDFSELIMENGVSSWCKKLMEHGCVVNRVSHHLFSDLSLSQDELQKRMRRTNKHSVEKGGGMFDIEICDESSEDIGKKFSEFHSMHVYVSGRETRSQITWNIQQEGVKSGNNVDGYSFAVFIRDKITKELAGAALFDTTHDYGLYCVGAYDRSRFSFPVSHVIQAVAMQKMRSLGVKWYELGERPYITDIDSSEKTVNIGLYKEGFATNTYVKLHLGLDLFENISED